MNYRKVNNLTGWITGLIATIVYLTTMEPTVSFWDCGEFLSCAYKIEVGHSPGAPLFMMIQRMFALLAGGNAAKAAYFMNAWSAIASGLTILFLFWTITHFAKRLMGAKDMEPTGMQTTLIMGAGLVGALAYTFSDTFWFSAVEAEVYATSSFFTALVVWAILKWEHIADTKYADRWIVFIAYMIGLSVGIHLLCLLTIPAMTMVYYFKRYQASVQGTIIAFLVGCVLLGLVQYGVLQGLPILASGFDLMFVNSMDMPFDSGAIVSMLLLVGVLVWLLMYAKKKNWYLVHISVLSFTFIVIGFTSYLAPLIRSRADVPIDMTNPDNAISLTSYLQREQFGSAPLLFGPYFDTRPIDAEVKGKQYARSTKGGKDTYEEVGKKLDYVYEPGSKHFFPRIWDGNDPQHVQYYRDVLGLAPDETPTTADNFKFFFSYHLNWMWWRYLMWNYSGRQNDLQGMSIGNTKSGNWITGIPFVDKSILGLGDLSKQPDGYVKNSDDPNNIKYSGANNKLYMLPFILGVLGMIYQFNRNKKDGIVTLVLFFFTGIAIAIFLNMPPLQPRERDYAFAGSTYAFAIWIGLGVLMVNEWLQKAIKGAPGAYATIALCLVAVPTLMAKEEWDDHDRSNKTLANASAYNALVSLAPNAILFTFGDNDTYPLWYLQEIEHVRPDVRIINTSLLGIDWYIDQLNMKINDADAVPMIWKHDDFIGDHHNVVQYYASPNVPQDKYINLVDICKFMISSDPQNKLQTQGGDMDNYYPTKNFYVPSLSKEELVKRGLIKASDTAFIVTDMKFNFPKTTAYKDDIATLNIVAAIAQEGWQRPIYFNGGLPGDNYQGMDDYMRMEGIMYRLMPFKMDDAHKSKQGDMGSVDLDKSYDLFMNKYKWGNAERNDVYYDEKNRLMFATYRINGGRIANEFGNAGMREKGKEILDKVMKNISRHSYFYDYTGYFMAMSYYNIGYLKEANELADKVIKNQEDDVNYILTVSEGKRDAMANEVQRDVSIINSLAQVARQAGDMKAYTADSIKIDALTRKISANMNIQQGQQQ
ncbi:MAG: DUF2723 domain-containing protein [Bacteroidetes bacterium]|nr:DUF2723 domain-containing protein [Bacteroidota bacterium]